MCVLVDHQHGFRSNRSCERQLINTTEHLARSINNRNQTDLLILDFSKAFETVAHKRLLLELEYYGSHSHRLNWMQWWLLNRTQQVVLEGEHGEKSKVESGVPQGSLGAPLLFYFTLMTRRTSHPIWNFLLVTPSCMASSIMQVMLFIFNKTDTALLAGHRNGKSTSTPLNIYRIKNPTIHHYTTLGQTLKAVDHQPYLRITISEILNWKTHVLDVENKVNRTLGCIKRNLNLCPERVKSRAYTSLVRPGRIPEYGSSAWDPYRTYQKNWLKQVQKHAARLATKTYIQGRKDVFNIQALIHLIGQNWSIEGH